MKKLLLPIALVIILLLGLAAPTALALVEQSADYYVADYASVLTEQTKYDIIDSNQGLETECKNAQIVVVTIDYLTDGLNSEQYAMRLMNDWGVGSQTENNGMLLLLVTEQKKAWLAVGLGIMDAFNENMVEEYFDRYFWEDFDAGRYDTATRNMLEALFTWYGDYYDVPYANQQTPAPTYGNAKPEPVYPSYEPAPRSNSFSRVFAIFWLVFFIIVIFIIFASVGSDRSRYRSYYVHHGIPMPRYHWWYMWGHRPHRVWYRSHHHHHRDDWRGPRGPRGPGGGGFGGGGGRSGGSGSSGRSGSGFGGFGGGGRSGSSGRSGGGFGGFGGSGRSGGGGGFRGGGGFGGGGGGGGGRR